MLLARPAVLMTLIAVIALATAPTALAQATLSIDVQDLDAEMTVPVGGTPHRMNVKVVFGGMGFICSAASKFDVNVRVDGADPDMGFNASVDPPMLSFSVQTGAYVEPPLQAYSREGTTALTVEVTENVPPNHGAHTLTFVAEWDGTRPPDCQASSWPSAASVRKEVPHAVTPEYPTGGVGGPVGNGPTGEDDNKTDGGSKESPMVSTVFLLGAGASILVAVRRRR